MQLATFRDPWTGDLLTIHNLPPNDIRWTRRRKAIVAEAIHHGIISLEDAAQRYAATVAEVASWSRTYARTTWRIRRP